MRVKQSKGGRFEHLLLLSAITNPINVSNYALIHYLWYQEVVWRSACVGSRFFVQVLGLLVSVSVLCLLWCKRLVLGLLKSAEVEERREEIRERYGYI